MLKPSRKTDVNQRAHQIVAMATGTELERPKSVMAEMGSRGGKIGGKRRAERMSPEQRKQAASLAARARWGKKDDSNVVPMESKQKSAARKLAALFEEQLTELGLTEQEKNERVLEFSEFVDSKVSAAKNAKSSKHSRIAVLQA